MSDSKVEDGEALSTETTSEEEEEEEEDEGYISVKKENQFLSILKKIKNKDPAIYDKDAKLFDEDSFEELSPKKNPKDSKNRKENPITVKSITAQQLLKYGPKAYVDPQDELEVEDELDENGGKEGKLKKLLYNEEQRKLKEGLEAAFGSIQTTESDSEDFGGLLEIEDVKEEKTRLADFEKSRDEEYLEKKRLLRSVYEKGTKDETEEFLKGYLERQAWINSNDKIKGDDEEVDLDEDEKILNESAKFESNYNFRFQEPGGTELKKYVGNAEGGIRQKLGKKKKSKLQRKQRLLEEKKQKQELINKNKKLKKKEIKKKISKILKASGGGMNKDILADLLGSDNDVNLDDLDKKMLKAFGKEYYKYKDKNMRRKIKEEFEEKSDPEEGRDNMKVDDVEKERKELKKMLKEYNDIEENETGDGLEFKFPYIQVPKVDFGLTAEELLFADEKELNEYVNIKFLEPYRARGMNIKYNKDKLKKLKSKIRKMADNGFEDNIENERKTKFKF